MVWTDVSRFDLVVKWGHPFYQSEANFTPSLST